MSNHQKEAKLKASTTELIGPLLKRLKLAKEQFPKNSEIERMINQTIIEVVKKKDILDTIGNWDRELSGYFGKIERDINNWIDHNYEITEWNNPTVTDLMGILNQLSQIQKANPPEVSTKPHEKESDLPQKATNEVGKSSDRSYHENELFMVMKWIESVGCKAMSCLYSLAIFPEYTELKRRFLIYWWIGLGLAYFWEDTNRTAEHIGEVFFSGLVKKGVLIPVYREHNQIIDRCTIQPTIFKQLISACERKHRISFEKRENGIWDLYDRFNMKGLLNLDENYLNSRDISCKDDTLVIQLGRWNVETEVHNGVKQIGSEETKLKDHIDVDEIDFLKKLGANVTYLSLRGISGIEEIPESIGKLQHLIILDLRACHNLEKLSQKPKSTLKPKLTRWTSTQESSWFEKLMVLDISDCYLLDHMPKWLCELSNLEVLKGFVVSGMRSETQSCRVGDLSKLNKLRKLSIRISSEHLVNEDFSVLKTLNSLLILTIIWRGNKSISSLSHNAEMIPTYSFPKQLEKLDIRCYPEPEASNLLNPTELTNLKRLYIRGEKLTKIPCDDNWKVETLRLRFLNYLKTDWYELRRSFENLKYVEYVACPKPENFPTNGSSWSLEKDEPNLQSSNATMVSDDESIYSFKEEIQRQPPQQQQSNDTIVYYHGSYIYSKEKIQRQPPPALAPLPSPLAPPPLLVSLPPTLPLPPPPSNEWDYFFVSTTTNNNNNLFGALEIDSGDDDLSDEDLGGAVF